LGDLEEEADETWKLYLGFFLVGLSQPLYQCTPALLSASWFPENERTMATGVALNSNQLGIGCAFIFGTMLVSTEEDIVPYFGLLSIISTITFVGAALQFDDAPPTPPSDTARVIKGSLEIKIPDWMKAFGGNDNETVGGEKKEKVAEAPAPASTEEPTECAVGDIAKAEKEMMSSLIAAAPSPAPGEDPVGSPGADDNNNNNNADGNDNNDDENPAAANPPMPPSYQMPQGGYPYPPLGAVHPLLAQPHPLQQPTPYMMPPGYYYPPPPGPYGYAAGPPPAPRTKQSENIPSFYHGYDQYGHYHNALLETTGYYEDYSETYEGVEPVMTQLGHHLDVDVRDDQIVQQFKACFSRPGFAHCVVAFTTSGIVINTLSTFMDYLVTLEGAGREYVGIVGGAFQMLIMASSLVFGGWTDHSRKYYFMTLFMLITGAFSLAVCNVNLDSDAGGDLRLNLLIVAVLTGPLQPISTELGVEVVYPLSENTVLVIQQLFSNLLSAAFIPVFKLLRDVGTAPKEEDVKSMFEVPQYTFSFYMLIIIHACSTLFFATFNGKYLRYEAELEKKAKKEEAEQERLISMHEGGYGSVDIN